MKVARIIKQTRDYLDLRVPSKSRPGSMRQIQFWEKGTHNCNCPRYGWAHKTQKFSDRCRHWRETTMVTGDMPTTRLKRAIRALKQNARSPRRIWSMLRCLHPHRYKLGIRCTGCPFYPYWCNVHPIRHSRRGTMKPVVWKIQTALYNGNKKEALRLMRKLLEVVEAVCPETQDTNTREVK